MTIGRVGTRKQDSEQSLGREETFDEAIISKPVWKGFKKRHLY